jgi:hypothetical protein
MIGPAPKSPPGCLGRALLIAAWLLAAFVVLALPPCLWLRAVGLVAFSPARVEQIISTRLVDSGLLRQALVQSFIGQTEAEASMSTGLDLARATRDLAPEERDVIWGILLPSDWVNDQVHQGIENVDEWLQGRSDALRLELDLVPLKQRLAGGGGARLVDLIVLSWPACSEQQLAEMTAASAAGGDSPLVYCNPPGPLHGLLVNSATASIIQQARRMPDTLSLLGNKSERQQADMQLARQQLRLARVVLDLGWLVPFSLLGIVMALAVRSPDEWMRWWGWPLWLGGMLALFLALIQGALLISWIGKSSELQGLPPALQALIRAVAKGFLDAVGGRLAIQGVVFGAVGGGLLIARRCVGKRPFAPAGPAPAGEERRQSAPPGGARPSGMFG